MPAQKLAALGPSNAQRMAVANTGPAQQQTQHVHLCNSGCPVYSARCSVLTGIPAPLPARPTIVSGTRYTYRGYHGRAQRVMLVHRHRAGHASGGQPRAKGAATRLRSTTKHRGTINSVQLVHRLCGTLQQLQDPGHQGCIAKSMAVAALIAADVPAYRIGSAPSWRSWLTAALSASAAPEWPASSARGTAPLRDLMPPCSMTIVSYLFHTRTDQPGHCSSSCGSTAPAAPTLYAT